ncbi:MAG: hypothetical protein ACOX2G_10190 [Bacillota bacterium]
MSRYLDQQAGHRRVLAICFGAAALTNPAPRDGGPACGRHHRQRVVAF